jgi:hypothetical protein
MVWEFGSALTRSFTMPERLEPLDRFSLDVERGEVVVDEEAVRFRVHLIPGLSRTKPRPTDD